MPVSPCFPLLPAMQPVSGEFGTSGDKELLTLDFLPPDERQDGTVIRLAASSACLSAYRVSQQLLVTLHTCQVGAAVWAGNCRL